MSKVRHFLADERGQDLIEYTLLMAFVALASAGIFVNAGKSVKGTARSEFTLAKQCNGSTTFSAKTK